MSFFVANGRKYVRIVLSSEAQSLKNRGGRPMSNILNTPDTTASYSQQDIDQNKIMGILSYFGILVLIPIFAAKESPFARFHANQGLVLLVTGILVGMATSLVGMLFGLIHIDVLTVLWNIVSWLIRVAMFALMILGIVNAASGRAKELPLVGNFRILK